MSNKEQMFDSISGTDAASADAVGLEADSASLKAEVERLRAELHDIKAGQALEGLLAKSGAKNPAFLKKLLNVESIVIREDGEAELGPAEEMLAALRRTDGYLFSDGPDAGSGAGAVPYKVPTVRDTDAMSDAEYYAFRMMKQ